MSGGGEGPGQAGAATGGSSGTGAAMHCEPGTTIAPYPWNVVNPCSNGNDEHGLPNPSDLDVEDFRLDAPTTPGQKFAFSWNIAGAGPFDVEIWGTHDACGVAAELLWWGPMNSGMTCGEFTPTGSYEHLLYVERQLSSQPYGYSMPELRLCDGGSCPTGATGNGLAPGVTLSGAPLVYKDYTYTLANQYAMELGDGDRGSHAHIFLQSAREPSGQPNDIAYGVFRMGKDDPFGDAWYCVGDGSTVTYNDADPNALSPKPTYDVSLKNITKLPSCSTLTGTDSLSATLTTSSAGKVTSTLPMFAADPVPLVRAWYTSTSANVALGEAFFYLTPAASPEPNGMTVSVTDAFALTFVSTQPFTTVCSTSGSVTRNADETGGFDLHNVATVTCPGAPVTNDTFEFSTF